MLDLLVMLPTSLTVRTIFKVCWPMAIGGVSYNSTGGSNLFPLTLNYSEVWVKKRCLVHIDHSLLCKKGLLHQGLCRTLAADIMFLVASYRSIPTRICELKHWLVYSLPQIPIGVPLIFLEPGRTATRAIGGLRWNHRSTDVPQQECECWSDRCTHSIEIGLFERLDEEPSESSISLSSCLQSLRQKRVMFSPCMPPHDLGSESSHCLCWLPFFRVWCLALSEVKGCCRWKSRDKGPVGQSK